MEHLKPEKLESRKIYYLLKGEEEKAGFDFEIRDVNIFVKFGDYEVP